MSEAPVVYIVDDDADLRASLSLLMRSQGLAAEACADADDFLSRFRPERAGCVLLDVRMPRVSGVQLLQALRSAGEDVPVIMLSGHADVATATRALLDGAMDFLEKPFSDQRALDRVNEAIRAHAARAARRAALRDLRERFDRLSDREREVLGLLLEGLSSPQAAAELGLSRRTVEMHRGRIMKKVGAGSFAELVRLAMQRDAAR